MERTNMTVDVVTNGIRAGLERVPLLRERKRYHERQCLLVLVIDDDACLTIQTVVVPSKCIIERNATTQCITERTKMSYFI